MGSMGQKEMERAQKRHRQVLKMLKKEFPDCMVTYNGLEGIDHQIIHNEHTTYVETKTCDRIIRGGIHHIDTEHHRLFEKYRLGRFKFNKKPIYPYKKSQHDDLVELGGWYVFVVGGGGFIISGCPAREVRLGEKPAVYRYSWGRVINRCHPNWLDELKEQVYGAENILHKD